MNKALWTVAERGPDFEVLDAAGKTIARIYSCAETRSEDRAAAHLMAAAPELLRAAQRALNVFKAQGETSRAGNVLDALKSAIAQAEGHAP